MVEKTGLEAELELPNHISVPSGAKTVDVDVLATLHNHDADDHVVHVSDADDTHFWQLFDDNHKEVQRSPGGANVKNLDDNRAELVPSGHGWHESQTVKLDTSKLRDGRRYHMRYVTWDQHAAEASINVTKRAPAKAPATGAPAKAKKR